MSVGDNIQKIRKERKITQADLAKKANLSEISIRKYENGSRYPKLESIRRISAALDVPVSSLIDDWVEISPEEIMDGLTYQGGGFYGKEAPKEVYDKFIQRLTDKKSELSRKIDVLNSIGQQKALDYVDDLSKIPEYRREPEPGDPSEQE